MSASHSVRYATNLIRTLRDEEEKTEKRHRLTTILAMGSFAFLVLAVIYTALSFVSMNSVLKVERQNLDRLKSEFQKYTLTANTVDKTDVELLNQLQIAGVFWSKKLAALGQYLPEGYWLKKIRYEGTRLTVSGFAQNVGPEEELLTLQRYLRHLEEDSLFREHFPTVRLNQAKRNTEESNQGMVFDFYCEGNFKKSP